jgi:hypothetical protein
MASPALGLLKIKEKKQWAGLDVSHDENTARMVVQMGSSIPSTVASLREAMESIHRTVTRAAYEH